MSAQTAANPLAVVKREVAKDLVAGDQVIIQIKNEPTSDIMVSNYVGRVESVIWKNARVDHLIVRVPRERTPSRYENTLAFVVVEEYDDDWQQRLLRRRQ